MKEIIAIISYEIEEPIMQARHAKTDSTEKKHILSKALIRLADQLALSRKELSTILGLSESSLSRLYDGKRTIDPQTKEGELAILLLRLYRSLDTLFGGNSTQCQLWLRSHNLHLGLKPIKLIETIQGLTLTLAYLDVMRGKN